MAHNPCSCSRNTSSSAFSRGPFDTTAFFLEEMRVNAKVFLQEVHTLASYYHWSEADILGLRRDRRRTYLALLSDALRQE